jgi:DNA-binding transcriptional MerR regulator
LPKKLFYRIGEACKQLDIQPYVLRYWETEFAVLSPKKSKAGQRVYSEEELHLIQRIKQLLYEEGYTIAGAKKKLDAELAGNGAAAVPPSEPAQRATQPAAAPARAGGGKASAAAARLDRSSTQQVESLRSELRAALAEARAILRLLSD